MTRRRSGDDRPRGRPRQTWLRTVENDLKHQNLGLCSARHRAYDREQWREIVETATLSDDDDDDEIKVAVIF